ncbi:MAG: SRPBCC family protein [Actinomycetota bacterium]|nr:SRPBCC family protein [Actinomycetota bacterium]
MMFTNQVPVAAPAADVFALITEIEKVAGCLPGASLGGSEGESYRGSVRVKVGPVAMTYGGVLRILEVDEAKRSMRLKGQGTDTLGGGAAEALVEVRVEETAEGSLLHIGTDLVVTGKIVAFGKGAIVMVAERLLQQFAENLGGLIASPPSTTVLATTDAAGAPTVMASQASQRAATPEALDPFAMLVGPRTRMALSAVGIFTAGMIEGWLVSRAFGRRRA